MSGVDVLFHTSSAVCLINRLVWLGVWFAALQPQALQHATQEAHKLNSHMCLQLHIGIYTKK